MDLCKYITTLLVIFWFDFIESGGHHEGKHDHLKVYVPEFIHNNHHTKYITIHHHHHKPQKHHHHHHIHIPKSKPSFGHHYHKHKKGSTTLTTTSVKGGIGHGHHGHGHHKHGHHPHKHHHAKHHGHHGHKHHHHEAHDPYPVFEDEYDTPSYVAPAPHVPQIPHVGHGTPHVHGVSHTVKHVKVFDSLPGALPAAGSGYEVTENTDDEEDDVFNSISDLPQTYPSTYGFVRSAAPPPAPLSDSFSTLSSHGFQPPSQHSFSAIPSSGPTGSADVFTSTLADVPSQTLGSTAADIPSTFDTIENHEGFGGTANSFIGTAPSATGGFLAATDENLHGDTPVSFAREAGIQQKVTTGGHETITY